jgi:hypothetical protein
MLVVRVELQRPYSFVMLALLIAIFGVLVAFNTPTDTFRASTPRLRPKAWRSRSTRAN